MIILVLFAFISGIVTVLSPCILPILPIVLSGSLTGGKRRPLGVITGFIFSFTFFAVLSFTLAKAVGLSTEALRNISVILLILFGISIFIPQIQLWIERLVSGLQPKTPAKDGFIGGLILGVSLGLVWTPCVGPIIASVLTLAALSRVTFEMILITFAYSVGTALPLLLITYGGQRLLKQISFLKRNSATIQKAFGVLIIITAVMIYFNYDRKFQTYVLDKFPQYGLGLTSFENNKEVKKNLGKLLNKDNKTGFMGNTNGAPNPDFEGATKWLNSDPLTLGKLKGKVVLVDFWTYTCINCVRTFPHLRAWYEQYKDNGFEIIGVHSPEFEFEKDATNVLTAMKEYRITYPVVQDNDFVIWRSYNNQYWPAHYLIDKQGKIRYTHFGEGEYEKTESMIRKLLEEGDGKITDTVTNVSDTAALPPVYETTPETYVGYARVDRLASPENIDPDEVAKFSYPNKLSSDSFALKGNWGMFSEYAQSDDTSELEFNFNAKEVYLVMSPGEGMSAVGGKAVVEVYLDGRKIDVASAGVDVVDGQVTVNRNAMYRLVRLKEKGNHVLRLIFGKKPIQLFAFTFG